MSSEFFKSIPTSPEVWAVIRARHPDLVVYSSFSNPNGDAFGGSGEHAEMFTSYGFKEGDFPIIEARTTWDIDHENPTKRSNEKHEYWLCAILKQDC